MPSSTSPTPATLAYLLLRAATLARRIIHREETQDAADYDAASCLLTALAHALQVGAATPDQLAQLGQMAARDWDPLRTLAAQLEALGLHPREVEDLMANPGAWPAHAAVRVHDPIAGDIMERLGGFELLGELPPFGDGWHQRQVGDLLILARPAQAVR